MARGFFEEAKFKVKGKKEKVAKEHHLNALKAKRTKKARDFVKHGKVTKGKKNRREKLITNPPFRITESVPENSREGNIRLRVDDPEAFDIIRKKDPGRKGFTVLLVGRKEGEKATMTQAVLFSKKDFGRNRALSKAKSMRNELIKESRKRRLREIEKRRSKRHRIKPKENKSKKEDVRVPEIGRSGLPSGWSEDTSFPARSLTRKTYRNNGFMVNVQSEGFTEGPPKFKVFRVKVWRKTRSGRFKEIREFLVFDSIRKANDEAKRYMRLINKGVIK